MGYSESAYIIEASSHREVSAQSQTDYTITDSDGSKAPASTVPALAIANAAQTSQETLLIGARFCLSAIEMLAKRGTGIRARGPSLRSASSEG